MADLLNQDEIDALLNSSLGDEQADSGSSVADNERPSGRSKRFFYRENKNQRFQFAYHSPVIKQTRFILNPSPERPSPRGKVVVRSLDNYTQHLRHQRSAIQ